MSKLKEKKEKKEKNVKSGKKEKESVSSADSVIITNTEIHTIDDEEIRNKAHEIYNYRLELGISGSAEEDWQDAERCLIKIP